MPIKISSLTVESLRNNEFEEDLPELYELRDFVENNEWHNEDSVFDHSLRVLERLETTVAAANDGLKSYLNQKLDLNTRKELLFLAALFHDIGKKETIRESNDSTACPNHEAVGAEKALGIVGKFDLSEGEKERVVKIIKNHGEIHKILETGPENLEEKYEEFKESFGDLFPELILLAAADTLGSQFEENDPGEFNYRMDFFRKALEGYS